MQSSQSSMRVLAHELGVGFLEKYSETLLQELGEYISAEFLFGDFIFRDPVTGEKIGMAHDLKEMQQLLETIPDAVLQHHTELDHISKWMWFVRRQGARFSFYEQHAHET